MSYLARIIANAEWIELYHGGDEDNLKKLQKNFKILTPDEKRQVPSTGGGKIGLSTSTDKKVALNYSKVFGYRKVLKLYLSKQAKVYPIDSQDKGIDEFFTNEEIFDIQAQGYDAISDVKSAEKEYRILRAQHVKFNIE